MDLETLALEERVSRVLERSQILSGRDISVRSNGYWDSSPLQARLLLMPKSTEEVAEILSICHEMTQTVVIHGGLTGCAQGGRSTKQDVIISTERINKIIEIDPVTQTITAEAGVILETIQNEVAAEGLYLPLDLGARGSCTIGGNIATNAGGNNVLRYGMARSLVIGLEGVLPDGKIVSSLNKYLKDNAGYDVKQMLIGSEGTLGVVTRVVLKLEPAPTRRQTAMLAIDDYNKVQSVFMKLKAECASNLTSFELMFRSYYDAVTQDKSPPLERGQAYYLLVELCDQGDGPLLFDCLEKVMEDDLIVDAVISQSESQREKLWEIRDNFEEIAKKAPVFMYDVSLGVAEMEKYVSNVEDKLSDELPGAQAFVFGHIGDGNLHLLVSAEGCPGSPHDAADRAVYEPLRPFSGSISGEHGIGHEKKDWLGVSRSQSEIAMMKAVKRALDPKNILNKGVVFNA